MVRTAPVPWLRTGSHATWLAQVARVALALLLTLVERLEQLVLAEPPAGATQQAKRATAAARAQTAVRRARAVQGP